MGGERVRIGLIGAGGMGRGHLKTFGKIAEAEVVGVADPSPAALEKVRKDFSVLCFSDIGEMIERTRPAGCVVASPHPHHLAGVLECVRHGVHAFTEKPMTSRVAETDQMIAAARKAGLLLGVMFQARTEGRCRRAKEMIDAGALGEIRRVAMLFAGPRTSAYYRICPWRGTWAGEGGGVLLNQAPHPIDRAIHLAGMPSRVLAARCDGFGHVIETEDRAEALVDYPNGGSGYFLATTAEGPGLSRLEISGDFGRLILDDHSDRLLFGKLPGSCRQFLDSAPGEWDSPKAEWQEIDCALRPGEESGHIACLRDFCLAVRDNRPPMIIGEDGRQSMELANAITLSAADGAPVDIPLSRPRYEEFYAFACAHGKDRRLQELVPLWRRAAKAAASRKAGARKIARKASQKKSGKRGRK